MSKKLASLKEEKMIISKSYFRLINLVLIISLFTTGIALISLVITGYHKHDVVYFGKLSKIPDNNIYTKQFVTNWISRSLSDIFDFNYTNDKKSLRESSNNLFTEKGAESFIHALTKTNYLEIMHKNQFFSSFTLTGTPVIVASGIAKGQHAWKIQVPGLLSLRNNINQINNNVVFTVVVVADRSFASPTGLVITQLIEDSAHD